MALFKCQGKIHKWVSHTASSYSEGIGVLNRMGGDSFPPSMLQSVGDIQTERITYTGNSNKLRIKEVKLYLQNTDENYNPTSSNTLNLRYYYNGTNSALNGTKTVTLSTPLEVNGTDKIAYVFNCSNSSPILRGYFKAYAYVSKWDEWTNEY